MARALWRARSHGVLARREEVGLHLFAVEELLFLRGGLDDRGPLAPLHGHERRKELRRHSWTKRGGFRIVPAARLSASAPPQSNSLSKTPSGGSGQPQPLSESSACVGRPY